MLAAELLALLCLHGNIDIMGTERSEQGASEQSNSALPLTGRVMLCIPARSESVHCDMHISIGGFCCSQCTADLADLKTM